MASLRLWLQANQVFDNDLVRLLPTYGVTDPDKDLHHMSDEQWTECQTLLINEKHTELKDAAALNRFQKKLDKVTKLWKQRRKAHSLIASEVNKSSVTVAKW